MTNSCRRCSGTPKTASSTEASLPPYVAVIVTVSVSLTPLTTPFSIETASTGSAVKVTSFGSTAFSPETDQFATTERFAVAPMKISALSAVNSMDESSFTATVISTVSDLSPYLAVTVAFPSARPVTVPSFATETTLLPSGLTENVTFSGKRSASPEAFQFAFTESFVVSPTATRDLAETEMESSMSSASGTSLIPEILRFWTSSLVCRVLFISAEVWSPWNAMIYSTPGSSIVTVPICAYSPPAFGALKYPILEPCGYVLGLLFTTPV